MRAQICSDLNVEAVEVGSKNEKEYIVSKAIFGLRFIFSFFVVLHHVGVMPWHWLARIQSIPSINVTGFMFIAGFSIAPSGLSLSCKPVGWRRFIVARIATLHSWYLIATVYTLPLFYVQYADELPKLALWQHISSALLHIFGFGFYSFDIKAKAVNGSMWFLTVMYLCIFAFPLINAVIRKTPSWIHSFFLVVFVVIASFIMPLAVQDAMESMEWTVKFRSWICCFISGVLCYHVWLKNHPGQNGGKGWLKWSIITDGVTLMLIGFVVVVATLPCYIAEPDGVFLRDSYTYFPYDRSSCLNGTYDVDHLEDPAAAKQDWFPSTFSPKSLGRFPTQLGELFGMRRMCTPVIALWVYGLARGHGVTAYLLSGNFLVRYLAPLSYPLYLIHIPTAMYTYWISGIFVGTEPHDSWWWTMAGLKIVPVSAVLFLVVLASSFVIIALLEKCFVASLTPYVLKFSRLLFCIRSAPSSETTLGKVTSIVMSISGTECDESTLLDRIGIDSLGTVGLLNSLRRSFPGSAKLTVAMIHKMTCVGDIVKALDHLEEEELVL